MRSLSLITSIGVVGLVVGCSHAPPATTPVAWNSSPRQASAPARPQAKAAPDTRSNIVIADEIRRACGITDEDAYFAFDSAQIRQADHGVLTKLATCFETGPLKGRNMHLVGHCDPRGSDEYNMVLGGRRAESVKQYLSGEGLAKSQMETTSRGELDANGYDEPTWSKDRRVDILLAGSTTPNLGPSATRDATSMR
jgi:peptidoglycan-associated lipoprotein